MLDGKITVLNPRLDALHAYSILDTPPDPHFDILTRLAADTLNVPMALITLIDDQRFWCKSSVGPIPHGASLARQDSLCAHLLDSQHTLIIEDASTDPIYRTKPIVTGQNIRFYAGIALFDAVDHVLGTLCVMDTVPRALQPHELGLLRSIATAVTHALDLHRTITDLRESEAHHRAAIELNPQIPYTMDPAGRLLECGAGIVKITGFTTDQIRQKSWLDVLHPDDCDMVARHRREAMTNGKPLDVEHRMKTRDGAYRWFRSYAAPRRDANGAVLRWYGTIEDVTDRRDTEAQVVHLAYHDSLTSLPNRARFKDVLEQRLLSASPGQAVALLLIDLDNFKLVNDTYGHPAGDQLLCKIADRILACVRLPDMAARIGGDEFSVVITLDAGQHDISIAISRVAQRLLEHLTQPMELSSHIYRPRASIGIAFGLDVANDPDKLQRNADLALYRAKNEGRNGYRLFAPGMDELERSRNSLKLDLDSALQLGEFELAFQPIIDIRDNRIRGFEALLRWRHPKLGLISPGDFIAVAEQTGLMVPIGGWALRQACQVAAGWPPDIGVSVNLSAIQFRDRDLIRTITRALHQTGLQPSRLELEITESMLMLGDDSDLTILDELHALGVRITLDDFGTGRSSLNYLHRFKFDKLKIDRSFITRSEDNDEHRAIIRAITSMSRAMAIDTVGEGVETQEQFDLLRDVGCDQAQGYLLSWPIPATEIPRLLHDRLATVSHLQLG